MKSSVKTTSSMSPAIALTNIAFFTIYSGPQSQDSDPFSLVCSHFSY